MAEVEAGSPLRVPLELSIPRLLSEAGYRVRTSPWSQRRLHLYDTADGRLAAAGAELSFSTRDGWTWRRTSLGHPRLGTSDWVAPRLTHRDVIATWSRAYRRGEPLAEVAMVVVQRRSHDVSTDHADDILALDEERIDEQFGGGTTARLRRVLVTGSASGRTAARAAGLLAGHAIDDAATVAVLRPALVRSPSLRLPAQQGSGARELYARSAILSMIQWLHFDCEVSGGGASAALRKMRVALRRLRSDLQTFAPLLDRAWAGALREQLGALADRLGVVRDAEVLVERLGSLSALLPPPDRRAAQGLLDIAGEQLSQARAELLDNLAGDDYLGAVEGGLAAALAPRWAEGGDATPPVTELARRPWRRLRDAVSAVEGIPGDAELHRIRILAKRARYAADACVPAMGQPAATSAQHLADLQTVLGDHHDAAVTGEWLRRQGAASAELAFAAGQLAGVELRRLGEATHAWPAAWAAASRRKEWQWLRS